MSTYNLEQTAILDQLKNVYADNISNDTLTVFMSTAIIPNFVEGYNVIDPISLSVKDAIKRERYWKYSTMPHSEYVKYGIDKDTLFESEHLSHVVVMSIPIEEVMETGYELSSDIYGPSIILSEELLEKVHDAFMLGSGNISSRRVCSSGSSSTTGFGFSLEGPFEMYSGIKLNHVILHSNVKGTSSSDSFIIDSVDTWC